MSNFRHRQFSQRLSQGFTLVELIVVIVLLGILAAVAIPRFFDARGEARLARMQAFAGALQSAVSLGKSTWYLKGQPVSFVLSDGTSVVFIGTAPSARTVTNLLDEQTMAGFGGWVVNNGTSDGGYVTYCLDGVNNSCGVTPYCAVRYTVSTASADGFVIDTSRLTLSNCAR